MSMETINVANNILENLKTGETLYTTRHKTNYTFLHLLPDKSVRYSIKDNSKTLPFNTILAALKDIKNGVEVDVRWYYRFNDKEYKSRPCNLSVLKALLKRV